MSMLTEDVSPLIATEYERYGNKIPDRRPDLLWHYTDANGAIGLVRDNNLWLTDYRYMNDRKELEHGADIAKAALSEFINSPRTKRTEFYKAILDKLENEDFDSRPFIFCLSERPDDLNQWRSYAGARGGFSIGFDTRLLSFSRIFMPELHKVIYDTELQKRVTLRLIEEAADVFEENIDAWVLNDLKKFALLTNGTVGNILTASARFKHPAFKDEEEWRLVLYRMNAFGIPSISFRSGIYGLTPYIAIDESAHGLPIRKIIVGPSSYSELNRISMQDMCGARIDFEDVSVSDVPYRS